MTATALFDYLVLKPGKLGLSNGLHLRFETGVRIPGSEVAKWGGRGVVLLLDQGVLAAVPAEDGTAEAFAAAYPSDAAAPVEEPVVEAPVKPAFPKHIVAGKFELSDGSEVQGKAAALEAQAKLDEAA